MFIGERHYFLNNDVILKITYCALIVAIILVLEVEKIFWFKTKF